MLDDYLLESYCVQSLKENKKLIGVRCVYTVKLVHNNIEGNYVIKGCFTNPFTFMI